MSWKLPFGFVGYLPLASSPFLLQYRKTTMSLSISFARSLSSFSLGNRNLPSPCAIGMRSTFLWWDFACEYAFAFVLAFEVDPAAFEALRNVRPTKPQDKSLIPSKPGSKPSSTRIWKPLHMPRIGRSCFDKRLEFFTELCVEHAGEYYAGPYVVSVGKATGKHQHMVVEEVTLFY